MWLTDPELFLYSKVGGDDVQVWRCKKTMMMMNSSPPLVVPMVPDDFEYVSQVEDHSDLVDGDILEWEETDYKALVKYISERRLLVNGQGLVIAELSKFSEEDDQTDADILPIYLRSLDILSLKAYIPDLMEQPIPSRKVQYLEDADGKAAPVEGGDSTTTTKQILAELQDDLKRERSEKQALEAKNAKLKQDVAAWEDKVVDLLESNKEIIKTLEEKVTMLSADLVVWKQKFTDLESKSSKTSRDQEERITKLNADLEEAEYRESWMNDITPKSEWVEWDELKSKHPPGKFTIDVKIVEGEYEDDDGKSNVSAGYWYTVQLNGNTELFKAVAVNQQLGCSDKAKFDPRYGWYVRSNEKIWYVVTTR